MYLKIVGLLESFTSETKLLATDFASLSALSLANTSLRRMCSSIYLSFGSGIFPSALLCRQLLVGSKTTFAWLALPPVFSCLNVKMSNVFLKRKTFSTAARPKRSAMPCCCLTCRVQCSCRSLFSCPSCQLPV